jgi:hypothetical protein
MKTIVVLLAVCTMAVAADTCNTGPKFIDLQTNPSHHYGFTLFCDGSSGGHIWAVAIAHGDWKQTTKGKDLAAAYMIEHKYCNLDESTCAPYLPIRAHHTTKPYCIDTESHGTQCLVATYGQVWEDQDGTEHVQIKLRGTE